MPPSPIRAFNKAICAAARPLLLAMVHVPPLPGSPLSQMSIGQIAAKAAREAEVYAREGIDGMILENMWDVPYQLSDSVGPHVVASMAVACMEVNRVLGAHRNRFLLGVQVLAAANEQALAVAQAAGFDFIRAECFVFSHVADEGWIDGCAGRLLRYRKEIGAEEISIIADIKKKHSSHSVTSDVSLVDTARAAEFFLADGVILTGSSTGQQASVEELKALRLANYRLPVVIGSGVTPQNCSAFGEADAFIVGSHFKEDGHWMNELDAHRIRELVGAVKHLHNNHERGS